MSSVMLSSWFERFNTLAKALFCADSQPSFGRTDHANLYANIHQGHCLKTDGARESVAGDASSLIACIRLCESIIQRLSRYSAMLSV